MQRSLRRLNNVSDTKKAVFFDIDGTLWGRDNRIPDSTREAIRLLKDNGHSVFLCTGRTRAYVNDPELLSMNFDGIVCGCGTRIEYQNQVVFDRELTQEEALTANHVFSENGMTVLMEGNEWFYANRDEMTKDGYGQYLYDTVGDIILELDAHMGQWKASKFSVLLNGRAVQPVFEALRDSFDFMVHGSHVMEVVPKGFSKSSGILRVTELLRIPVIDTIAFGDSANDIDMLETAGIGIAMGNASDDAKAHADYITDDLHHDGIYNACRKLHLIE